jgi:hypothetical protein
MREEAVFPPGETSSAISMDHPRSMSAGPRSRRENFRQSNNASGGSCSYRSNHSRTYRRRDRSHDGQKRPTGTDEDANVEWSGRRNVNVPAGNTKENLK